VEEAQRISRQHESVASAGSPDLQVILNR
jgi:hypothetical protein